MENQFQLAHQIEQELGKEAVLSSGSSKTNPNEVLIETDPANVKRIAEFLKTKKDYQWMMDICGVHYPDRKKELETVYHFYNYPLNKRVRMKVQHSAEEKIPSITSVYKAANWFEREAYDMMGVQFDGHPDLRRILCHHEFKGHALRKDYPATLNQTLSAPEEFTFPPLPESEDHDPLLNVRTTLNLGPSHPATHGTFRWYVELEGERIMRSKAEIGYLHRCFEKMCETHKYQQVIPYTDRLNYLSAPMNNAGYCQAIERLLDIDIPSKAKIMRLILNEFSRIIDHLVCIGTTSVDMGALTVFWYCFRQREDVYTLFEKLCGNRMLTSITRIGGMVGHMDKEWIEMAKYRVKELKKTVDEVDGLLTNSKIWIKRMKDTGVVSKQMAIDYAFTGPALRASGVAMDLRKTEPYYHYDEFEFDVPTREDGDNYSRYMVRIAEMRESLRILEQALDRIPEGPTQVDDPLITLPPKEDVYSNIEALMNHFMLIIEGIKPPQGEVYSYSEAANGELGFYVVSDGTGFPYRVKCRPPCFPIYSSFEEVIQDGLIADAVATLGQFNVIAGELDR